MNVKRILYDFTVATVNAAPPTDAISGCAVRLTRFGTIKPGSMIEISDVMDAKVVCGANAQITEENIEIAMFFIVAPTERTESELLAAQDKTRAMAYSWLGKLYADRTVNGAFCYGVGDDVRFSDDWINPTTAPVATCVVRLKINPR